MPINSLMPALPPNTKRDWFTNWPIEEGDKLKSGDILAGIETDKATMEIDAVNEGALSKILNEYPGEVAGQLSALSNK